MRIKKTSQYIEGGLSISDIYPVGSIYISVNNTNPSILFGGTWEQIKDTFLLSAGDTYTAGNTGGEATHTLTTNEMPIHRHTLYARGIDDGNSTVSLAYNSKSTSATSYYKAITNASGIGMQTTGNGQAHNNMPPYIVVYMWKRTA